ncbi:MAG: hypothetical protein H7Y43_13975, partial [Akkermansiaceae bacterium]|nr:hypothetical protein [Verrucomicrobiales bacterium]
MNPGRRFCRGMVLLCCFLFAVQGARAVQPYSPQIAEPLLDHWRWQKLPELDGKAPRSMVAGKDGVMWFGVTEGVMRYDGINWTTFPWGEGLPGAVNALHCSESGDIYAATMRGLSRFTDGKWTQAFPFQTNQSLRISQVMKTGDGTVWAGGSGFLLKGNAQGWVLYCQPNLAPTNRHTFPQITVVPLNLPMQGSLQALRETRDGLIWFAFDSGEVHRLDPRLDVSSREAWQTASRANGFHNGLGAQTIYQTSDDLIWSVNSQHNIGQNQYDPHKKTWNHFRFADLLGSDDIVFSLTQTPDGTVWAGGMAKLFRYQNGQWRMFRPPEVPISTAEITGLVYAHDCLWVLGVGDSVQKLEFTGKHWLKYENVNFQAESPDGTSWFLALDESVVSFDGTNWLRYVVEDGLMASPNSVICTREGKLWASGSHNGLAATAVFDGVRWNLILHTNIPSRTFDYRTPFETADGCLWFGTYVDGARQMGAGGLIRYNPKAGPPENPAAWASYLRGNNSTSYGFGQMADGRLFSGSYLGLVQFNGSAWVDFGPTRGERIDALCNSPDGRNLWMGTRGSGLFRYDGEKLRQFDRKDGLGANSISSVFSDRDNRLWVGTSQGVSLFDGQEWVTDVFPEQKLASDGGSMKQARDGALWINQCARNWMRRILPGARPEEKIQKNFWTVRYQREHRVPDTEIVTAVDRVSQPGNTVITWRGMDLWSKTRATELLFSTRLNDGPWSKYELRNNQVFLELPAGRHVFEVRSRDKDLNVDPTPARVEFVVLPPVWKEPWFLGLMTLLAAVITTQTIRVLHRDRTLQSTNKALAVEIDEHERTEAKLEAKSVQLEDKTRRLEEGIQERQLAQLALEQQHAALEKEIEERKRMEREVEHIHKQLLATSRQAGMAEIASNVLHEVGNVLTSLNTSVQVLATQVDQSKVAGVQKLNSMLQE